MTDEQINRAVAEHLNQPLEPPCARYHSTDESEHSEDGWSGFCYTCGLPISEVAPEPLRYTTDPAAWGGLLVWLAADREPRGTSLDYWPDEQLWEVTIGAMLDEQIVRCRHALPGRALCLAALRAYGVEVTR